MICTAGMTTNAAAFPFGKKKKAKTEVKSDSTAKKKSKYDELFKDKHETATGMITLHKMKGKLYFEMPIALFGREMLIGSTITEISDNGHAVVGSKPTAPLHVYFTKDNENVQLRQVNTDYITNDSNIDRAVKSSNIGAILANAKIAAFNNDSTAVVFEMTDFFVSDNKEMTPFDRNSLYGSYNCTQNYKSDLSYLSGIKAFSDNVSIKSSLSYTFSVADFMTGRTLIKDQPFTVELTRSIVLLPETPARPRMADYRIGIFFTEKRQLGEGSNTTAPIFYANRWQLIPSDSAAYRRGELVKPVKPIVFYVDNNFPEKWKPYLKEGINQWQEVFEKAGFKEAIIAKDFPTDDPEFDPDNIKYSCVRYAPIGIENAMGPSWVDPRSGEILTASVYVYHDIIKLINSWLFTQTSAADKDVRTAKIPDEIIGDALRYVLAHEIGHCLGLMHNMSASTNIPVDSLRSPSFTQKYGTTMSIMDYARFNYVAQPGDKERGVKLTPPRFGPYDEYAIKWSYTPILDAKSTEEETPITTQWITDAIKNPLYRYGKQQLYGVLDPRCQTEDLSDDAVKATEYGIKNLKTIMSNYCDWIKEGDDDFEFRTEILLQIINQYAMYVTHVYNNVGGLYINEVKYGDELPAFENMPKDKQVRALKMLFSMYDDLDWLENKELMTKLSLIGSPRAAIENFMATYIINTPFRVSSTADITMKTFSFQECADMVYDFVWKPTINGARPSRSQMDLQTAYIELMMKAGGFETPGSSSNAIAIEGSKPIALHNPWCGCTADLQEESLGELTYNPVGGFGWRPRMMFQKGQATVADVYAYMTKVKNLLNSRMNSAPADIKAHYQLLVRAIEFGLK